MAREQAAYGALRWYDSSELLSSAGSEQSADPAEQDLCYNNNKLRSRDVSAATSDGGHDIARLRHLPAAWGGLSAASSSRSSCHCPQPCMGLQPRRCPADVRTGAVCVSVLLPCALLRCVSQCCHLSGSWTSRLPWHTGGWLTVVGRWQAALTTTLTLAPGALAPAPYTLRPGALYTPLLRHNMLHY